jgi:hypothetical protein
VNAAKETIADAAGQSKLMLRSQEDLVEISGKRLVDLWNGLPGVEPVKKFTSRKVAVERIWKEVEKLEAHTAAQSRRGRNEVSKNRVQADEPAQGATAAKASKKSAVLDPRRSPEGATLADQ